MLVEKDTTASTNDDARELALAGAPEGAAVLARAQTRGRGRAGRPFESPAGGLYLSVVLRPDRPPDEWGLLPLLAGTVVARELGSLGFAARVKWPNDVLIAGKKVGGILVESLWGPPESRFAVVGIGLNLDRAPVGDATSLAEHGPTPGARALAERLASALAARMERWRAEGRDAVLAEARAACVTLGKKIGWEKGEGVAVDLAEDGALVVETSDGARRRIVAGDVRLRVAE